MGIMDSFSTSTLGMNVQSTALENISGNIANSTTAGYKRVETSFADLIPDTNGDSQVAGAVGAGSRLTNTIAGKITLNANPTNMALSGAGYFVVGQNTGSDTTPAFSSQDLYTRRGDFTPDASGYLKNGAGYYLMSSAGGGSTLSPIKISTAPLASGAGLTSVSVGTDGKLTGSYSDGSTSSFGKVAVAQFRDDARLKSEDGGAYSTTLASGAATLGLNGTAVEGGALEGSNTDISDQFSKMIMTQQAYQSNSKVLSSANEMMQTTIGMIT